MRLLIILYLIIHIYFPLQVLEEIRRRDIVVEVNNPVFKISLVLNVPCLSSAQSGNSNTVERTRRSKGRVKWNLPEQSKESSDLTGSSQPANDGSCEFYNCGWLDRHSDYIMFQNSVYASFE